MHQQRQYVANTSVNFSDFRFFVKPGDLCRHHEDTGDFIIFRNGALLAKLKISIMALKSMMTPETQFFSEIKSTPVTLSPEPIPPTITIIEEPDEEILILNDGVPAEPPPPIDDDAEEVEETDTTAEGIKITHRKKRQKK